VPPVPSMPLPTHVRDAKHLLLEEFLGDFPFINDSSRAQGLACLLLPFVRDLIDGPSPLHMIEKPTSRTGGTLLATMLALPAVGPAVTHVTEAHDADEWRKVITAVLVRSPLVVCLDNVRRRLEAASLASALTATVWTDRILGHSETVQIPVRTVWIATGNNPTMSDEIAGRTVFIRLDAKLDRPQDRADFRHPLPGWALEHRGELVHAALILCQSWISAGRPPGRSVKGGFGEWSAVLGGIVEHIGVSGFLLEPESEFADPETQAWVEFVRLWWDRYKDAPAGVADLFQLINPTDMNDHIDLGLGDGTPQSQKSSLGKRLIERRDRQFSADPDYRLQLVVSNKPSRARARLWQLKLIQREVPTVSVMSVSECFSTPADGVLALSGASGGLKE